jgi:restriction system protein
MKKEEVAQMLKLPSSELMYEPVIASLRALGGSGTYAEVACGVVDRLKLDEAQQALLHNQPRVQCTEFDYRLERTLDELALSLMVERCDYDVWALTEIAKNYERVDTAAIRRVMTEAGMRSPSGRADTPTWRQVLLTCIRGVSPQSFEMLVLRVLREHGLHQITITERAEDHLSGRALVRLGGLVSQRVVVRCQRGSRLVDARQMRAMREGLDDAIRHALFVTTFSFSREAMAEAYREDAIPIDLIDGRTLAGMFHELELGVVRETSTIEHTDVDEEYFELLDKDS